MKLLHTKLAYFSATGQQGYEAASGSSSPPPGEVPAGIFFGYRDSFTNDEDLVDHYSDIGQQYTIPSATFGDQVSTTAACDTGVLRLNGTDPSSRSKSFDCTLGGTWDIGVGNTIIWDLVFPVVAVIPNFELAMKIANDTPGAGAITVTMTGTAASLQAAATGVFGGVTTSDSLNMGVVPTTGSHQIKAIVGDDFIDFYWDNVYKGSVEVTTSGAAALPVQTIAQNHQYGGIASLNAYPGHLTMVRLNYGVEGVTPGGDAESGFFLDTFTETIALNLHAMDSGQTWVDSGTGDPGPDVMLSNGGTVSVLTTQPGSQQTGTANIGGSVFSCEGTLEIDFNTSCSLGSQIRMRWFTSAPGALGSGIEYTLGRSIAGCELDVYTDAAAHEAITAPNNVGIVTFKFVIGGGNVAMYRGATLIDTIPYTQEILPTHCTVQMNVFTVDSGGGLSANDPCSRIQFTAA